jgi:hypothetical protein
MQQGVDVGSRHPLLLLLLLGYCVLPRALLLLLLLRGSK